MKDCDNPLFHFISHIVRQGLCALHVVQFLFDLTLNLKAQLLTNILQCTSQCALALPGYELLTWSTGIH